MNKKILITENDLSNLIKGLNNDKNYNTIDLHEQYKESGWKRFWSASSNPTDLGLRLLFPDLEKLRNVVSNDSMPALQRFFQLKVFKPKVFDTKNNEGYIKDSNTKLHSISELSKILDSVISKKKTFSSIEHLLPGKLPTNVNFKDELRKHLGHIEAEMDSEELQVTPYEVDYDDRYSNQDDRYSNQDDRRRDYIDVEAIEKFENFPWEENFTNNTLMDWANDDSIDWELVFGRNYYDNIEKMDQNKKVAKLTSVIINAINGNNYEYIPRKGFGRILDKDNLPIQNFKQFLMDCVTYGDDRINKSNNTFVIHSPENPRDNRNRFKRQQYQKSLNLRNR